MIRVPAVPEKNIKNAAAEHPGDRKCSASRQQKNRQNQCRGCSHLCGSPGIHKYIFRTITSFYFPVT